MQQKLLDARPAPAVKDVRQISSGKHSAFKDVQHIMLACDDSI